MKAAIEFIKTTVLGGIVIVIPIAVIVIVLGDFYHTLIEITSPLTKGMTFGPLTNTLIATLFVVLVIVAFFFIAGLLLNTFWGKSTKNWLEQNIFERIPMYSTLSQLTQRIAGIENSNFPVVEVDLYGTANRVLGIVIDTLPDGRLLVYTPSSPVITVGQLNIVAEENVKILDVSITNTLNCLSMMGLEADKIYRKTE